jgi:putative phosphoesterase
MRLGILADTHDDLARTRRAIELLRSEGAEVLIHCGDLASPAIVEACAALPCYFVFGNHDADSVPALRQAAERHGAVCLGWGRGGAGRQSGRRRARAHDH